MSIKDSPWSQSSRYGERIFKESTFNSYPHTCTLDHVLYVVFLYGSMLWLYNINILSMPFKFSYPKLHISHSCRALRERKILVRTHTQIPWVIWENHMRSNMSYVLFWKILKNSNLTWEEKVIYVFKLELFHFPITQGDVLATSKPIGMSMRLGISFMLA